MVKPHKYYYWKKHPNKWQFCENLNLLLFPQVQNSQRETTQSWRPPFYANTFDTKHDVIIISMTFYCRGIFLFSFILCIESFRFQSVQFFINPAVSEANMVDTCKHFEIGSGSVRSLSHLPVFVIEHLCRAKDATNTKQIK